MQQEKHHEAMFVGGPFLHKYPSPGRHWCNLSFLTAQQGIALLRYPFCCCSCLRCPIRDEENVDIAAYFSKAHTFIEQARGRGTAVLVHCHEGKSRSITLVLAYLMKSQARPLPLLSSSCSDRHLNCITSVRSHTVSVEAAKYPASSSVTSNHPIWYSVRPCLRSIKNLAIMPELALEP